MRPRCGSECGVSQLFPLAVHDQWMTRRSIAADRKHDAAVVSEEKGCGIGS